MVSLFSMALFGIFTLIVMGIVSNTSQTAITAVENQIFLINCPMPLNGAIGTLDQIDGLTVNYTIVHDNDTSDYHITVFICYIDSITGNLSANTEIYTSGTDWFSSTTGTLFYLSAGITSLLGKVVSFLTIFSFILTPANFEVLGYTLDDLSGISVMVVVGLYITAYVFIVVWLWVTFNPFKGSG